MNGLKERLTRLAEWYEAGPKYPVEFEEGRQQIAADIREALTHVRDHADFAQMHRDLAAKEPLPTVAAAHIRFAEEHEAKAVVRKLIAIAPDNWNDGDDPEQQEAWQAALDLIGEPK